MLHSFPVSMNNRHVMVWDFEWLAMILNLHSVPNQTVNSCKLVPYEGQFTLIHSLGWLCMGTNIRNDETFPIHCVQSCKMWSLIKIFGC